MKRYGRVNYANRGKHFEKIVDLANEYYRIKGMAEINKEPTPIKALKVIAGRVRDGVYEEKARVDYYGVYNGQHISFDAKSTNERTRFPLDNIKQHQMDYLKSIHEKGGQAFILLNWEKFKEVYVIPYLKLAEYWQNAQEGGRKSIPYEDMLNYNLVKSGRGVPLDYLKELG
ncbi:Holliday junction resolvase RecU [Schinkia azotoformans]|uniref:Holliday junction resolvase RecU n=1 Tax=Schinkia azotoformans LMG 9581 TaxID=1131731 RepID=K6D5Q6_SCHAZ|nr:Holliday junction resolvase RecU [Schinkia azotoformans]EKN67857.1 Holliday junction-specific endonuclease [Schinkia azotoformans LMG 9581]MEC1637378.1 Holliday junction resolvase RecU [Schinkia azotoformans]MEC1943782.1 Holliday junction resolvase RecU [Schinkia azotoformans]